MAMAMACVFRGRRWCVGGGPGVGVWSASSSMSSSSVMSMTFAASARGATTRARAASASASASGGRTRAPEDAVVGDVIAYSRKGETRLGTIDRADGKTGWIVREGEEQTVKVAKKTVEANYGAGVVARDMEAFANKCVEDDSLIASAWELIHELASGDEIIDALYVSDVVFGDVDAERAYAAHRMLNSPAGGLYFKTKAKGQYEPRTAEQIEALTRKAQAEARVEMLERAFVDEIKAAVAAPRGDKPDPATLWRHDDEDNGARVRRFEALQAYALGEKFHSPGEKAMADDLLTKLGFSRSPESALKTLIATGAWSAHENLAIRRYNVPIEFPEHAHEATQALLANAPPDPDAATRVDLTHLKVYAIDDAGTVEVDDGLSVQALGDDGVIRVWVHIADPTRWIERDSTLDHIARRRATTVYYPSEMVPMFPLALASGPMSLGGDKCEAMTVRADIDREGCVLDFEIMPSYVKLDRRWTYDDVDAELKSTTCDADLRLLFAAARARDERRADDGAVTILLPEVYLDVKGATARGGEDEHITVNMSMLDSEAPARMLVSEMMVLVGDVVGGFGAREGIPLPYRGQNEPRLMSDDEWDRIPEGICQDIAMRMSMSSSTSGATPRPHSGLGLQAYVQFTSPIRRYTDILAHYQIKAHLRGERPLPFADVETLERMTEDVGASVGAAIKSQRETTKYWSHVYFSRQPADARWRATLVKLIRGDDLALVIFEDLGFETVVKLDRAGVLGETLTLRFVDADPHAGFVNFARCEPTSSAA